MIEGGDAVPVGAVVLDVGGVLLLPHPGVIGEALTAAGIVHRSDALPAAHYHAVATLDATSEDRWDGEAPTDYVAGFLGALAVPGDQQTAADAVLREVLARPSLPLWSHVTDWARPGLAALAAAGPPLAIVSNSDGSVRAQLARHELCQVGPGPGTEVVAIVDSAEVGVAKPDPAIFEHALQPLELPASVCWYVGDTVTFDVDGARAAGLEPLHLDPIGACGRADHAHVATLTEVASQVRSVTEP